jgi:hypothetical protein
MASRRGELLGKRLLFFLSLQKVKRKAVLSAFLLLLLSTLVCEGVPTRSGYFTTYVCIRTNASYPGRTMNSRNEESCTWQRRTRQRMKDVVAIEPHLLGRAVLI